MSYLLDTSVVSQLREASPDPEVALWFGSVHADDLYLSVLVVGEIRQGVERLRRKDPRQAAGFDDWLIQLARTFADRLLPVSVQVGEVWGRLNARRSFPVVDGLLAATAVAHDLVLVTRNVAGVAGSGARVLNPFAP
jgi:toxin FitB